MGIMKLSEKATTGNPQASQIVIYKDEFCKRNIIRFARSAVRHRQSGNLRRAEISCEQALHLAQRLYGVSHIKTAGITMSLAKICHLQGKSAEAALLNERAHRMLDANADHSPFGGSAGFYSLLAY